LLIKGVYTTGGRVPGKKYPMSDSTRKRYKETCRENRVYKIEKEELVKLYIEKNKTRKEIASLYSCSEVLVKSRLKEYGIKKR
jgi:transposase-like protein